MPNNGNQGQDYDVFFSTGILTQDIVAGVTINQLFMSGGTLILANPLTLDTGLQFSGGTIENGTLNVAGLSAQSATMGINSLTVNNSGIYNLTFDGTTVFSGGGSIFNNSGSLVKNSGTGVLTFNIALVNTGTVASYSGDLQLAVAGTSAATFIAGEGATLEFTAGYTFNDGVTFSGAGTLQLSNNTDTHFTGGTLNNSGNIVLNTTGNLVRLFIDGATTLTGGGTITLFGGANAQLTGGGILTNVDNTIQGFGNIGANALQFVNQTGGIFNANVTGQILYFDPSGNGFNNQGLLEATNGGIMQLSGNGGGGFTNSGTILADGEGSEVQLVTSVTITDAVFNTQAGGIIRNASGQVAYLPDLTNNGSYINDNNADTHVSGTLTNSGTITLNSIGNLSRLILDSDTILQGGGTITLNEPSNSQISGNGLLTNVDNLIQGYGNIGANGVQFINEMGGVFDANVAGKVLFFDPSGNGFINHGLLEATNGGILQLSGNGGGGFDNSGAIISADGTGSEVQLTTSVTVVGGTLSATNGGLIHNLPSQAVFLSNDVLIGPYLNDNNADTHVTGTLTNNNTITLFSSGNLSRLFLDGDTVLNGGGTIILNNGNSQIAGNGLLTNVDNLIQGYGNIGTNTVQLINQSGGVFNANIGGQVLFFDPSAAGFVNHGLLEATNGGILQLSGNGGGGFDNTGAIISADGEGSEVQLTSSVTVVSGTLSATNGGLIHNLGGQIVYLSNTALIGPYLNDNNADTHIIGTLANNDTITLFSSGNLSRLFLDGDTSLNGGGTVILNNTNSQIAGGGVLTNVDNLIEGYGNIGTNTLQVLNQADGVFNANVTGQILFIDPSVNGFANQGLLEATNGGIIQLTGNAGGGFVNTGGLILADGTGSEIQLLSSVTLTGGTLSATNNGLIHALGGQSVFLSNITLIGSYLNDNNTDTHVQGTITNKDTITLNSIGNLSRFYLDADTTLNGGGTIILNNPNSQIAGNGILTNVDNLIQGFGNIGTNSLKIINQVGGTFDANVAGQILFFDPSTDGFINQGVLEATNGGILQLSGNGGGDFTFTGTTILAAGAGSEVQLLSSVTITGGTFSTTGGGIFRNLDNQTIHLVNVTNAGTFVSNNNSDTDISGTIVNTGSFTLNANGNLTRLVLDADTTLSGGGTVTLASLDPNSSQAQITGGHVLTNVNNTIQGQGNLGANSTQFLNQAAGVIEANVNGKAIYVDPSGSGFVNQGLLQAIGGGILQLSGNGGGSFDNTGGMILASGANSVVQLTTSVNITGGTLTSTGGGIFDIPGSQSVFLANLTNAGNLIDENNSDLHVNGAIVNSGSITLSSIGNLSRLFLDGNTTLSGSGTLTLADSSGAGNAQIAGGFLLTNVNNTVQGFGNIGANSTQFDNQAGGIFHANVSGKTLFFDPNTNGFSNEGLLEATAGGILDLSGNGGGGFTSSGTIQATGGGALTFDGPVTSSGTVALGVNTLTVTSNGSYTQTGGSFNMIGGTVNSSTTLNFNAGLVNAYGTINGAVSNSANLQPALGAGGLAVNGAVSLLSASKLTFQLGGLTQGSQYGYLNVNGTVALGGQLVVSFVNSFQANNNNSFTVLSSTAPLSGVFTNVPSGSRLSVTNGSGSFLVTYSGSTVVLSDFLGNLNAKTTRKGTSDTSTTKTIASNQTLTNSDTPKLTRAGRARASTPRPGIAVQNSSQLLDLMEGANATTANGKVLVHPRPAAASSAKGPLKNAPAPLAPGRGPNEPKQARLATLFRRQAE